MLYSMLRDHLVVTGGSLPFVAITYFVTDLGGTSRFWPVAGIFVLSQHAFHATGAAFFTAANANQTHGLVLSGVYNFLIFLFAGLIVKVRDMSPIYRLVSWILPSYPTMGLMSYFLFTDRALDCDPLDHPDVCGDGDHLLQFFTFLRFQRRIQLSLFIILLNTLVARTVIGLVLALHINPTTPDTTPSLSSERHRTNVVAAMGGASLGLQKAPASSCISSLT